MLHKLWAACAYRRVASVQSPRPWVYLKIPETVAAMNICLFTESDMLNFWFMLQAPQAELVAGVIARRLELGGRALVAVAVRDRVRHGQAGPAM